MSRSKKKPEDLITIPFDALVLAHGEIGIHRGRKYGFRDVFGFRTLQDLPFTRLAKKVRDAYEEKAVPKHKGWPKQREVLKWFVDQGSEALYQLKDDIRVYKHPTAGIYYLAGGNHRALALYIVGAERIRAAVEKRKTPAYFSARRLWI
jgi:hypothetical protein